MSEPATIFGLPVIRDPSMPADTIRMVAAPTRADVLAHAERLRAAALLLEAHARHCRDEEARAHAVALKRAHGMVRRLTSDEERWRHE